MKKNHGNLRYPFKAKTNMFKKTNYTKHPSETSKHKKR